VVDALTLPPAVEAIDRPGQRSSVSPPTAWQGQAACYGLDPELFFPATEEGASLALSFCAVCVVRQECLDWALWQGERYGVWGGTSERQRRLMRLSA
jgi:WhiB family redox-sensing transcriptional regulator